MRNISERDMKKDRKSDENESKFENSKRIMYFKSMPMEWIIRYIVKDRIENNYFENQIVIDKLRTFQREIGILELN